MNKAINKTNKINNEEREKEEQGLDVDKLIQSAFQDGELGF